MNGYDIPDDGKLHINYSNLKRCTSVNGVMNVIAELKGQRTPFDGETVQIGKIRHEQWKEESQKTGRTPAVFRERWDSPVDFIEQAFAAEVFENVVLHFRIDAASIKAEAVIDYKKVVKGAHQFMNDMQLIIYAYGLQLHGFRIRRSVHLCEVWNRDMENPKIIGYQALIRNISMADIARAPAWLRIRANYLAKAQRVLNKAY